jgi:hypothetical protein
MQWERVIQFADHIKVTDGNTTAQYQWNQVARITENKRYLVMVFGNGLGIRLAKDGFTIGNPDTFLQFIKNEHQVILLSIKP